MSISDRYSCQEHGQDKHEDCIACEVYGDIAELVDRIAELEAHNEQLLADKEASPAIIAGYRERGEQLLAENKRLADIILNK